MGIEEVRFQSSEEILKKMHRAVENLPNQEEVEASIKRLTQPFGSIGYKESDSIELEVQEMQFKLSYEQVEPPHVIDFNEYKESIPGVGTHQFLSDITNWRRVTKLQFVAGEKTYDILKLFPKKYNILFCPEGKSDGVSEGSVLSFRDIFFIGNIATPRAIAVILHEVGHIWDDLKLKLVGKDRLVDNHKDSLVAETIRRERTANAYAIKLLRPFIKTEEQRKDFINFLKNDALLSHNLSARERIQFTEEFDRVMGHSAQDWDTGESDDDLSDVGEGW